MSADFTLSSFFALFAAGPRDFAGLVLGLFVVGAGSDRVADLVAFLLGGVGETGKSSLTSRASALDRAAFASGEAAKKSLSVFWGFVCEAAPSFSLSVSSTIFRLRRLAAGGIMEVVLAVPAYVP
jgi:hypothetical protein